MCTARVLSQEEGEDRLYDFLSVVDAARQHSKKVPCGSGEQREREKDKWPKNLTLQRAIEAYQKRFGKTVRFVGPTCDGSYSLEELYLC